MLGLPVKILKTIQLEAETDSVTFDDIDDLVADWDAFAEVTSRHLVLIINARSIDVSDAITNFLRFNGSAAMDYSYQRLSGVAAVASAGRTDGANAINLPPICGANNVGSFGSSMVVIPHAFNTVNHKAVLALGGASEFTVEAVVGRWAQIAAITSVTILEGVGDDFVVGSTFDLGVVDEQYLVEEIENAADFAPTFDNIPQGEGDLVILASARSDRAAVDDEVLHTINDDGVAGNYPSRELTGRGAAPAVAPVNQECAMVSGDNATPNVFGALVLTYYQYTKANFPQFFSQSGYHESTGPTGEIREMTGSRANIEPVNKIRIEPNNGADFKAGSLFSLYRVPKRIIDRQELAAPQATITFDNIPQNFEALQINVYARSDTVAAQDNVDITINGDAVAANYNWQRVFGAGAVNASRSLANRQALAVTAATEDAGEYGSGSILLPGYAESDRHKHLLITRAQSGIAVLLRSMRWLNDNPITRIDLDPLAGPNFVAGSVFELEGILKREGLPAIEGMQWGV